jgi:hypothetical protein
MQLSSEDISAVFRALAAKLGEPLTKAQKDWWLDPFTYSINFVTPNQLAASATSTLNFLVQNDSAFAICKSTYIATDVNNAAVANLQPFGSGAASSLVEVLVTLTDSGSGRSLMDQGIPIDGLFGTAQFPRIWPIPKILDPNSTFSATLQNLVATARHVRLAFHGYKIFGNIQNWASRHK